MTTEPQVITGKRHLIFISHAGADTWVAKQIEEHLQLCGADTFLDESHIAIGEDFEEIILQALDRADELLVLLTPWSLNRPYVWAEIGAAWSKRVPIIGIMYGVKPEDPAIPVLMKRRDMIDINQLDQYFKQLTQRVAYS
ncbi:MAG: toll/interleukin-1 receptor domain-containing protein [Chloroflexi bacterium]|nr:toll/interleukin-1 receptor domain-containing protein [Chloroflexota bacterium]